MSSIETPTIVKCYESSTYHITKQDAGLLNNPECALVAYRFEYGWMVFTGYLSDDRKGLGPRKITDRGFSQGFADLLKYAFLAKCKYLLLDRDGTVYPELAKHEW